MIATSRTKLSTVGIFLFLGVFALLLPAGKAQASTITFQYISSGFSGFNQPQASFQPTVAGSLSLFETQLYSASLSSTVQWVLNQDTSSGHDSSSLVTLDCQSALDTFGNIGALSEYPRTTDHPTTISGFTGTQCNLDVTKWYTIRPTTGGSAFFGDSTYPYSWQKVWVGSSPNVTTRIDTFVPTNGAVVSTTTAASLPFEVGGYLNSSDYKDGTYLDVRVQKNDNTYIGKVRNVFGINTNLCIGVAFINIWCATDLGTMHTIYPISTSTAFDFATTTSFNLIGKYNVTSQLIQPGLSIFGIQITDHILVATTTSFLISTTSAIDKLNNVTTAAVNAITDGSNDPLANCQFDFSSILDFSQPQNIISCLYGIAYAVVLPSSDQLTTLGQTYKDTIGYRVPFAYFTLAKDSFLGYDNITATSTSNSNLTVTFPNTSQFATSTGTTVFTGHPANIGGQTVTFINWENLATSVDGIANSNAMLKLNQMLSFFFSASFLYWLWRFIVNNAGDI